MPNFTVSQSKSSNLGINLDKISLEMILPIVMVVEGLAGLASPLLYTTSCGNWFSHCNSMFRFVADVSYVAIAMVGTYTSRCVITIIRYACFEFEFTDVGM